MLDSPIKNRRLAIRALSLGDQLFFSAASFILTITLARHYPEQFLAGYGVGFSIAFILQGLQRTAYIVQNSVLRPVILRRRAKKILGQQLLLSIGVFLAQILILGIVALIGGANDYFIAIACSTVVCTLIYLQLDFDRIVLIKHERFSQPMTTSLLFLLLCGALFFLAPLYNMSFPMLMGLLALFTVLKYLWLVFVIGPPDFFWGWRLLKRDFRKNIASSLLGVTGFAGFSSGPIFILGAISPPLQTAAFGAMRSLAQPIMILVRSMDIVDKNFFQEGYADPGEMRRSLLRLLTGYGGLSLLAIIAMAVLGPFVVDLVYGEKYTGFSFLLLGWGIIVAMYAISLPLETVIVKLNRLYQYNACRIPAGLIGIAVAWLFCEPYGAWGAVTGCIAGWIASVACALWLVRDILFLNEKTQYQAT